MTENVFQKKILSLTIALGMLFFIQADLSAQWVQANKQNISWVTSMVSYGPLLIAGVENTFRTGDTTSGVRRSRDNGATLEPCTLPDQVVNDLFTTTSTVYANTNEGIYSSADSGASWTKFASDLPIQANKVIALNDSIFYAATGLGVFKSLDKGSHWTKPGGDLGPSNVVTLAANASNVYALNKDGVMYYSHDDGTTWSASSFKIDLYATSPHMAIIGTDVYASYYWKGVYRSTDYGVTWTSVIKNLSNNRILALFTHGDILFAGTERYAGVYYSRNGGDWVDVHAGLPAVWPKYYGDPNAMVYAIAINDTYLFAAGANNDIRNSGAGIVWRRPLSEMSLTSVATEYPEVPDDYRLEQNYPNPFNPSTTIRFAVPGSEYVTLKIFDVLGRKVASLVSENLSAGSYERVWDASAMPSGTYFYRLQAGAFNQTKKLILLR